MSASRSSADVEHLLRRTYAEVAQRTTLEGSVSGDVVRLSPGVASAQGGHRRILSAVAALLLVVGGVFALANREVDQSAGRDLPTRVLPGWIPQFVGSDGISNQRPFALTELRSGTDRDRIAYASAVAFISVELDRTRGAPFEGEPVIVRGGPGRRTDSTLSWLGPDDALVEVSWAGAVDEAMIESFVQALAYVDDETWIEAARTAGFRQVPSDPLATVRVDADVPFDVGIVGDMHEGLSLQIASGRYPVLGEGRCTASSNFETSDPESNVAGYVVLAAGDVASVVLSTSGNDDRRIKMMSLLPMVNVSIGGAVYEQREPSSQLLSVECEGAS